MRTETFDTTVAGKAVTATVSRPETATEWIKSSGYTDQQLGQLIWNAWKVDEGQPEIRSEKVKTDKKATELAVARLVAGERDEKRSKTENRLREKGATDAEILVWKKMAKLGRK